MRNEIHSYPVVVFFLFVGLAEAFQTFFVLHNEASTSTDDLFNGIVNMCIHVDSIWKALPSIWKALPA
jgi:hypothetical protein